MFAEHDTDFKLRCVTKSCFLLKLSAPWKHASQNLTKERIKQANKIIMKPANTDDSPALSVSSCDELGSFDDLEIFDNFGPFDLDQHNVIDYIETADEQNNNVASKVPTPRFSPSKKERKLIDRKDITDDDVVCGRNQRGSKHPGNVVFRRIIEDHNKEYISHGKKHRLKTELSTRLLEEEIKGRFVEKLKNLNGI